MDGDGVGCDGDRWDGDGEKLVGNGVGMGRISCPRAALDQFDTFYGNNPRKRNSARFFVLTGLSWICKRGGTLS